MPVAKPELLYLSPVVPALTGNGLAMRAGMVLEALSSRYSVSLVVVKLYTSPDHDVPEYFARICRRCAVAGITGANSWRIWRRQQTVLGEVLRVYKQLSFEVIHVFRLAMLPFAQPFVQAFPSARCDLDLDDIESLTHDRIARLADSNSDDEVASSERRAADCSRSMEQRACAQFNRMYVCSQEDKDRFLNLHARTDVRVLPNAVRIAKPLPGSPNAPFSLLFVGTLGYYPNEDAALYLCRELVTRLRKRTSRTFEVRIVGTGTSVRLRQAAAEAGADVTGFVRDMRRAYERAAMLVVPIRAAGGTRIKILEAWSYGRPVIASPIGIEGLAARHDEHALIADNPDLFADSCLRLMEDAELSKRLIENSHSLVASLYSAEVLKRTIGALDD
ncbi:MAG: glycosyltransferase [Bryobacteraceae bacterium]